MADAGLMFAERSEEDQVEALRGLAQRALGAWNRSGCRAFLLKYRENAVFRVVDEAAPIGVLRVHRPGYRSDAAIRSEVAWVRSLAASGFETPTIFDCEDGDVLVTRCSDGVPEPRQCDLMAWVDGSPLGSLERGVDLDAEMLRDTYRRIGELAARLHEHAAAWEHPADFERPCWDIDALIGESPAFGRFWETDLLSSEQRSVLLRARDRAREHLAGIGPARQLIHGDLIPDNVLVDGDHLHVIDFDDCGWSWRLCELVTSVFPLLTSGGFETGLAGYLEGYRSVREYPDEELEYLTSLVVARGLSYLGWPIGRPEIHSQRRGFQQFAAAACELAAAYVE